MALAPRLEFKQSQQLVMTPQLQQAIKLLQLSNLELADFVQQQLEENPFLERAAEENRDGAPPREDAVAAGETPEEKSLDLENTETMSRAQEALDAGRDDIDPSASAGDRMSDGATDYKSNEWSGVGEGKRGFDDDEGFGERLTKEKSLREHLNEQLQMGSRDPALLFAGSYLIDLIDDAGYFRDSIDDVADRLGTDHDQIEAALKLIQSFDPSGVGARDLKECMRLQLTDKDRLDPAMAAFVENIELLAKGDLKGLMRVTRSEEDDVREMIAEIRALTPKPGLAFGGDPVQIVEPDVFVRQAADGGWKVELNNDTLPKVLVNQHYFAEVSKAKCKDEDTVFLNEQFSNANWLAKSLDQRARTILKVASEIVRQQDAFLVHGIRHLRPLNLKTVADAISMHESTVSRVTSNKYIATPRGVFELKYFFTASIGATGNGEAHSAESVRHRIRELVDAETTDAVLSDDKIVEILRGEGVDIARRTVAKYRETMNIPSSVQRRRAALREAI